MNKKVIPLIVQLKQNNNYIVQGINQNDAGVIFDMTIMDGLKVFDFSGYSVVTLKIKKPDGTFRYDSSSSEYVDIIEPTKGRMKINLPTSCTVQNGMHFCVVGFGYDETTYFETVSFNYFVGEDPNVENEDVIGTNEFPILNNLIAEASGMIGAEQIRASNEEERQDAEAQRQAGYQEMIANLETSLDNINELLTDAYDMIAQMNQAIAHGGSIDISQINALATKTYVANAIKNLDFSTSGTSLAIKRATEATMPSLAEGELGYATDTNHLIIGKANNMTAIINEPCFIASASVPNDTTKLWIDISGMAPIIKYYDGTAWVSCNTAVFA